MGSPLESKPEYNDLGEMRNFLGVPDILPVERISEQTLVELEKKRVAELTPEEAKDPEKSKYAPSEELTNIYDFDYIEATELTRKNFLAKFKLIRKGQV